jgi:hypothetical protein
LLARYNPFVRKWATVRPLFILTPYILESYIARSKFMAITLGIVGPANKPHLIL